MQGGNGVEKDAAWYEQAFPFKAEEFGQLYLPENVIKAKLVSLNNYGQSASGPFSSGNRARHGPSES